MPRCNENPISPILGTLAEIADKATVLGRQPGAAPLHRRVSTLEADLLAAPHGEKLACLRTQL